MIPASEKAKLEEMAVDYALGEVDTCHRVDYMAGAQAAFDLAVKYFTNGCEEVWFNEYPDVGLFDCGPYSSKEECDEAAMGDETRIRAIRYIHIPPQSDEGAE